ncbi:hypothetical protein BLNAU_16111 [Blattamonas nauphoetae]|uniref:Uncharacterized protein n=1 Tax=Blattamonas nauphoetae TaxID=2049346 RepID=A0ABQ9XCP4_9EUKA|nr:hypothetical protein BLNAU_16111 [Blattamonas nauphoetae]
MLQFAAFCSKQNKQGDEVPAESGESFTVSGTKCGQRNDEGSCGCMSGWGGHTSEIGVARDKHVDMQCGEEKSDKVTLSLSSSPLFGCLTRGTNTKQTEKAPAVKKKEQH